MYQKVKRLLDILISLTALVILQSCPFGNGAAGACQARLAGYFSSGTPRLSHENLQALLQISDDD